MATRRQGTREHRTRSGARLGTLAVVALWAVALGPGLARGADAGWIAADEIVQTVADGQPVELEGIVIIGDLDLHEIERVSRTFTCTRCTFSGSIDASNVTFERMVDLSGSTVAKGIDFGGAIFRDPFLMRAFDGRPARVVGPVSFALANFGGRAIFERAQFEGDADFRVAQFDGDASFADASIAGDARFNSATFAGRTQFNGFPATTATFGGLAGFYERDVPAEGRFPAASLRRSSEVRRRELQFGRLHPRQVLRGRDVRRRQHQRQWRIPLDSVHGESLVPRCRSASTGGLPDRIDRRQWRLLPIVRLRPVRPDGPEAGDLGAIHRHDGSSARDGPRPPHGHQRRPRAHRCPVHDRVRRPCAWRPRSREPGGVPPQSAADRPRRGTPAGRRAGRARTWAATSCSRCSRSGPCSFSSPSERSSGRSARTLPTRFTCDPPR